MEDNEIIELYWQRSQQAIAETDGKYGGRLQSLSMNILHDREDAEECVNDTYLAVWESIPPRAPEYLFAYTAKICRNLALNRVEWNHAAKRDMVFVELSEELGSLAPDLSDGISRQELAKAIADFLNRQTKEQREMFVRRYWYGETIKELAESFGCRQGKVKSVLFRLRRGLRRELEKEGIL